MSTTKGGDDPFPLKTPLTAKGKPAGNLVKGKGSYRAFQFGPFVEVIATGTLPIFNAEARLVASPIAVFPPEYGLFFYVPEIGLPTERPFVVGAFFYSREAVKSVVVWDVDGKHDVKVVHGPM